MARQEVMHAPADISDDTLLMDKATQTGEPREPEAPPGLVDRQGRPLEEDGMGGIDVAGENRHDDAHALAGRWTGEGDRARTTLDDI